MKLGGAEVNWSKMSDQFENLPDGDYIVHIDDVVEDNTKESNLPQVQVKMTVQGGDKDGKKITDFVVLKTNKGDRNDIGFGRVRAYYEAIYGEVQDGAEIDTDDLKGNNVQIVVKLETYKDKNTKEEKQTSRIKKVLPVG